eukprot:184234-Chlamydomonas_euryale.AAC.1
MGSFAAVSGSPSTPSAAAAAAAAAAASHGSRPSSAGAHGGSEGRGLSASASLTQQPSPGQLVDLLQEPTACGDVSRSSSKTG